MTTYSGLALLDHVLRLYSLQARIKEASKHYQFSGDYHIGDILLVLFVMLLLGAERLQHIDYPRSDPLFCRVARLTRIPHRTKMSTALKRFTSDSLKALIELNAELVIEKLRSLGMLEITIDLDGTVVTTKGHPTWAFKGYNPIKRGANSYFPLTAHVAETGNLLAIWNRPGNVHEIRIGPYNSSSELKNNYPYSRFASVQTAHSVSQPSSIICSTVKSLLPSRLPF
jgi:hypothetical protein